MKPTTKAFLMGYVIATVSTIGALFATAPRDLGQWPHNALHATGCEGHVLGRLPDGCLIEFDFPRWPSDTKPTPPACDATGADRAVCP